MTDQEMLMEALRMALELDVDPIPRLAVDRALAALPGKSGKDLRPDMLRLLALYDVETFEGLRHCYDAQGRALITQAGPARKKRRSKGSVAEPVVGFVGRKD